MNEYELLQGDHLDPRFGIIKVYWIPSKETELLFSKTKIAKSRSEFDQFYKQSRTRAELNDDYLLPLRFVQSDPDRLVLTEYYHYPNSDLLARQSLFADPVEICMFLNDCLQAVAYLQKNDVLHGNLRPELIYYDSRLQKYVLCDNFRSHDSLALQQLEYIQNGELVYLSEEVFEGVLDRDARTAVSFSHQGECFSVGLILVSLLVDSQSYAGLFDTGEGVFSSSQFWKVKDFVLRQYFDSPPSEFIGRFLFDVLFNSNPHTRLTPVQALRMFKTSFLNSQFGKLHKRDSQELFFNLNNPQNFEDCQHDKRDHGACRPVPFDLDKNAEFTFDFSKFGSVRHLIGESGAKKETSFLDSLSLNSEEKPSPRSSVPSSEFFKLELQVCASDKPPAQSKSLSHQFDQLIPEKQVSSKNDEFLEEIKSNSSNEDFWNEKNHFQNTHPSFHERQTFIFPLKNYLNENKVDENKIISKHIIEEIPPFKIEKIHKNESLKHINKFEFVENIKLVEKINESENIKTIDDDRHKNENINHKNQLENDNLRQINELKNEKEKTTDDDRQKKENLNHKNQLKNENLRQKNELKNEKEKTTYDDSQKKKNLKHKNESEIENLRKKNESENEKLKIIDDDCQKNENLIHKDELNNENIKKKNELKNEKLKITDDDCQKNENLIHKNELNNENIKKKNELKNENLKHKNQSENENLRQKNELKNEKLKTTNDDRQKNENIKHKYESENEKKKTTDDDRQKNENIKITDDDHQKNKNEIIKSEIKKKKVNFEEKKMENNQLIEKMSNISLAESGLIKLNENVSMTGQNHTSLTQYNEIQNKKNLQPTNLQEDSKKVERTKKNELKTADCRTKNDHKIDESEDDLFRKHQNIKEKVLDFVAPDISFENSANCINQLIQIEMEDFETQKAKKIDQQLSQKITTKNDQNKQNSTKNTNLERLGNNEAAKKLKFNVYTNTDDLESWENESREKKMEQQILTNDFQTDSRKLIEIFDMDTSKYSISCQTCPREMMQNTKNPSTGFKSIKITKNEMSNSQKNETKFLIYSNKTGVKKDNNANNFEPELFVKNKNGFPSNIEVRESFPSPKKNRERKVNDEQKKIIETNAETGVHNPHFEKNEKTNQTKIGQPEKNADIKERVERQSTEHNSKITQLNEKTNQTKIGQPEKNADIKERVERQSTEQNSKITQLNEKTNQTKIGQPEKNADIKERVERQSTEQNSKITQLNEKTNQTKIGQPEKNADIKERVERQSTEHNSKITQLNEKTNQTKIGQPEKNADIKERVERQSTEQNSKITQLNESKKEQRNEQKKIRDSEIMEKSQETIEQTLSIVNRSCFQSTSERKEGLSVFKNHESYQEGVGSQNPSKTQTDFHKIEDQRPDPPLKKSTPVTPNTITTKTHVILTESKTIDPNDPVHSRNILHSTTIESTSGSDKQSIHVTVSHQTRRAETNDLQKDQSNQTSQSEKMDDKTDLKSSKCFPEPKCFVDKKSDQKSQFRENEQKDWQHSEGVTHDRQYGQITCQKLVSCDFLNHPLSFAQKRGDNADNRCSDDISRNAQLSGNKSNNTGHNSAKQFLPLLTESEEWTPFSTLKDQREKPLAVRTFNKNKNQFIQNPLFFNESEIINGSFAFFEKIEGEGKTDNKEKLTLEKIINETKKDLVIEKDDVERRNKLEGNRRILEENIQKTNYSYNKDKHKVISETFQENNFIFDGKNAIKMIQKRGVNVDGKNMIDRNLTKIEDTNPQKIVSTNQGNFPNCDSTVKSNNDQKNHPSHNQKITLDRSPKNATNHDLKNQYILNQKNPVNSDQNDPSNFTKEVKLKVKETEKVETRQTLYIDEEFINKDHNDKMCSGLNEARPRNKSVRLSPKILRISRSPVNIKNDVDNRRYTFKTLYSEFDETKNTAKNVQRLTEYRPFSGLRIGQDESVVTKIIDGRPKEGEQIKVNRGPDYNDKGSI